MAKQAGTEETPGAVKPIRGGAHQDKTMENVDYAIRDNMGEYGSIVNQAARAGDPRQTRHHLDLAASGGMDAMPPSDAKPDKDGCYGGESTY